MHQTPQPERRREMELLSTWLARGNYLPHGYCFTWTPGLLWSMVIADGVIALAYYSIPIALVHLVRKRQDTRFNWIVLLFSGFIFASIMKRVTTKARAIESSQLSL